MVALGGAVALALTACSGGATPEVTLSQEATVTAETPESEETVRETTEAEAPPADTTGTRTAPLKLGEARKLADSSAWTVMLNSSTSDGATVIAAADEWAPRPAEGEAFLLGNFSVTVDAAAINAQGFDLANEGATPWASLIFEYVASDGTTSTARWGRGATQRTCSTTRAPCTAMRPLPVTCA